MYTPRLVLAGLLLAGVSGCVHVAGQTSTEEEPAENEEAAIVVRTEPAELRRMTESVNGLGRCEALPSRVAVLTAAVEGRVVQLAAGPGETVKVGQEIVRLDPAVAQANLEEKKTARDAQAAALRLLESLPRPEEQDSAKLAIEQARLAVDKSKATVEHLRPLRQRSEVSEAVMFEAELALRQAELQLKTAQAQFQVLMLRPRPQAIDEAKSRIATAEAAVATAQAQLDLHTIRSPIEGVLDSLNCQLGQTLSVGTTIGEVVDAKQVHVVVWLSVPDAHAVHRGQTAQILLGGPKSGAGPAQPARATVRGEVIFVGGVADPQTGNLPVRIFVDNSGSTQAALTLGQVVSATIGVNEKNVLAVPAAAVHDLGEGPLVTVVRGGKTVLLHPLLGLKDNRWIEIAGTDLKPGEPVIVEGGYNLPEGKAVTIEPRATAGKDAPR